MEDAGEKFKDVSSLEQRLTQGFSNLKKKFMSCRFRRFIHRFLP